MKYTFLPRLTAGISRRILAVAALILMFAASASAGYYLDLIPNNVKYQFSEQPDQYGFYSLTIEELQDNFKIFNTDYKPGSSGQDQYIYGAADGQPSSVAPDSYKLLSHPGSDMPIEGGGTIYGATFYFNPDRMVLLIMGGSYTKPEPTQPTVFITWDKSEAVNATTADISFTVGLKGVPADTDPAQYEYTVNAYYLDADARTASTDPYTVVSTSLNGKTSGTIRLANLAAASSTHVWLAVAVQYDGTLLRADTQGDIATPDVPILIGKFSITNSYGDILTTMNWDPTQGIVGREDPLEPGVYLFDKYDVTEEDPYNRLIFTGDDAFSFVTRLAGEGDANPWDVVNSSPRYAPSNQESVNDRCKVAVNNWFNYTRYNGSTSNAWIPQLTGRGEDPGAYMYSVKFSYPKKQVIVETDIITGINEMTDSTNPVNVYNMLGTPVKSNVAPADATIGLPPGIYILGNKKVMVK